MATDDLNDGISVCDWVRDIAASSTGTLIDDLKFKISFLVKCSLLITTGATSVPYSKDEYYQWLIILAASGLQKKLYAHERSLRCPTPVTFLTNIRVEFAGIDACFGELGRQVVRFAIAGNSEPRSCRSIRAESPANQRVLPLISK